jgi:pimeloyl-ACP methyl ester carboxylesterase
MVRKKLAALATAVLLPLAAWSTPAASPAAGAPATGTGTHLKPGANAVAPISWGTCSDPDLRHAHAQCGTVTVPLDYSNPVGGRVSLAVSRIKHTTPRSQGVMLVNPGGPGASGLSLALLGSHMPGRSGAGYDWIGFDPRGVGSSRPALSCRPDYFHGDRPPYVPTTSALMHVWRGRARFFAQGCQKYGALLDHMKTTDAVKDMDRIRQALGVAKISFYGFSYGTYLGQVYATMFPSHVRRMVLDSNVDPRTVWFKANLGQDIAFERVFRVFLGWVALHHRAYHLGRTAAAVTRLYHQQERLLARHPADGVLGPSEWDDAFLFAGYLQTSWPDTAKAFADWVHHHDAKPLIRAWQAFDMTGDDNTYAVYLAVQCTDAPSPTRWTKWADDSNRLFQVAPLLTWANTWLNAPCFYWPARPGSPVNVDGHHVRALLIDQTLDAATPFEGSLEVRSRFPGSRLVAITGGTTHASSPDLSGPCANALIAAFLKTGALPQRLTGRRADVSCPAPPLPVPGSSAGLPSTG